ncbi:hypothetical protein niasHT_037305 [Heterodera trifolii]|uniref:Uncharacterized protein n=1 Tax=Heterodera trifolii TaxID=157864 RepID=A0ABD2J0C7_9BILA
MTTSDNDSYESCITIAEDPAELAAHDNDKIKQTHHSSENEENKCLAKLENVLSNATATDESVSSSSFTNSTSAASINSRTALGVKNNNNNSINNTNSPSSALSSSSAAAGGAAPASVRHHQQRNRVLSFHLNGTVVHRRRPNSASKNPIHMLTNLFASMMGGERAARKYGVKRQILQRTRSSLRRPQLVSVRSRGSIFNQQKRRDMVTTDDNNNNDNNDFVDTTRENAFDMLLRFCETPADVAFLRSHPDHLERLGIPVEQYSTILEELNFFLIKREQLREAEQRVRERKQKREKIKK